MNFWVKVALVAAIFGAGWAVNGWRLGAELSDLEASYAKAGKTAADNALLLQQKYDAAIVQLDNALAGIDANGQAKLKEALNENDRFSECVRNGTCGLRIAARCPAAPSIVPSTAKGSSVDTGASAVLAPEAGQAYFGLRAGIIETEKTLTACQESLGRLTGQRAATPLPSP